MTIAVMTRASLGRHGAGVFGVHATSSVHASIAVAALARICVPLESAHSIPLDDRGCAWAAAFGLRRLRLLLCSARKF
jgi:uncharacterized protein involved in response to NO